MIKRMFFKLAMTACLILAGIAYIKDSGLDQKLASAWNQFTQSEFLAQITGIAVSALDNYKDFAETIDIPDVSGNN